MAKSTNSQTTKITSSQMAKVRAHKQRCAKMYDLRTTRILHQKVNYYFWLNLKHVWIVI